MDVKWHSIQSDYIDVKCPLCGHQTAPPEYPYCPHTLFVYVDGSADDAFFDFMRDDFKNARPALGDAILDRQSIEALKLPNECDVYEVSESSSYHPSRIIVAFATY